VRLMLHGHVSLSEEKVLHRDSLEWSVFSAACCSGSLGDACSAIFEKVLDKEDWTINDLSIASQFEALQGSRALPGAVRDAMTNLCVLSVLAVYGANSPARC